MLEIAGTQLTAQRFFLEWLPEQLRTLDVAKSIALKVSVLVAAGEQTFAIAVEPSRVAISAAELKEPTFRLSLDSLAVDKLLGPALNTSWQELQAQNPAAASSPALRLLSLDQETLDVLTSVTGCLEVRVADGAETMVLVFGPGQQKDVGCTIFCELSDLLLVQAGKAQPFELLMNGKLRIEGDPQIALALSSVLM